MTSKEKKLSNNRSIRIGWYSLATNITLFMLNFVMAYFSSSLALAAETAHNILDLLASVFVLLDLWLSQRKLRNANWENELSDRFFSVLRSPEIYPKVQVNTPKEDINV